MPNASFLIAILFVSTVLATAANAGAETPADPDPEKGLKQKNGYVTCSFMTRAKNKEGVEVDVPFALDYWLPAGYAADPCRRFPVIYVLQNMDIPRKEMSEMFRKRQFPPFIVVHTDGIRAPLNRGENGVWSDSQGPAGTIFRTELIGWVDKHFRTLPGPKGRVLVGCSKAGGAVMHLGANYPDMFSAVVSADGAIGLYDTGNNDGDYYTRNKLTNLDAIRRNGDAAKNLSSQMLLGSMFGAAGENDKYLKRFKSAGMHELEFQDCRHYGHDCDRMTADRFPEVMATFYNGSGDFTPWRPTVSHRAGIYAEAFEATVSLPRAEWAIRYTLDGSDPHQGGETTVGPIRVRKTSWLRAIGIAPDGKQQSREILERYTVQPPWPATTPGGEPGLIVRAYDLPLGGPTPVVNCLDKIEKGANSLTESVVPRPGAVAEPITQVADKTKFLLYTGTISVPETGVYEFDVSDCNGLFFPQPNRPWKEVGRAFAAGIGTIQVPLEQGAHPIVIFQVNTTSKTIDLRTRLLSTGEFASRPAKSYRH